MPPGQYVLLTVSDTGTGMTPEVKQRIFDPFFTTKKQGEGTGLGLATCHGIVKQSGGYIEVTTELGHGSTFWIYLPEVEGESKIEPRREESRNMPGGNETVLLVEDEPSVRGLAVMILRRLGYKVLEAASGNEALSIVDKTTDVTIDLLLTDVVMPQMSGKQLADRLHASHPEIKVLFASGYTEDAIVEQGILLPGLNFLHKPYTPSILAQRVREVLEAPTAVAVAGQI
jgi:two-component system cell cycle sensor histidine kinase/response regulator CckA